MVIIKIGVERKTLNVERESREAWGNTLLESNKSGS